MDRRWHAPVGDRPALHAVAIRDGRGEPTLADRLACVKDLRRVATLVDRSGPTLGASYPGATISGVPLRSPPTAVGWRWHRAILLRPELVGRVAILAGSSGPALEVGSEME